jgi:phage-related protein
MDSEQLKPVRWVGSSLKDLKSFPPEVKAEVGHALYAAQQGATDPAAKPLKGFGGVSAMEIVAPFDGNTWRAYYTLSRRNRSRASPRR